MQPDSYQASNSSGMCLAVVPLGASVQKLIVPTRTGAPRDVVLGFDDPHAYGVNPCYFGSVVGRTAARIWPTAVKIGSKTAELALGPDGGHLHGGPDGLHRAVWRPNPTEAIAPDRIALEYRSPDGESGYPGNLDTRVVYTVSGDNRWVVEFGGRSDADTLINLTQHAYFNLAGHASGSVSDHTLEVFAQYTLGTGAQKEADGSIVTVDGQLTDFRRGVRLGERFSGSDQPPAGVAHAYVLDQAQPGTMVLAARLSEPTGGLSLEVWTDQPVLLVYTGNTLDGAVRGKEGASYGRHAGICLETENFPNSVHHSAFRPCLLAAGREYRARTEYRFYAR